MSLEADPHPCQGATVAGHWTLVALVVLAAEVADPLHAPSSLVALLAQVADPLHPGSSLVAEVADPLHPGSSPGGGGARVRAPPSTTSLSGHVSLSPHGGHPCTGSKHRRTTNTLRSSGSGGTMAECHARTLLGIRLAHQVHKVHRPNPNCEEASLDSGHRTQSWGHRAGTLDTDLGPKWLRVAILSTNPCCVQIMSRSMGLDAWKHVRNYYSKVRMHSP